MLSSLAYSLLTVWTFAQAPVDATATISTKLTPTIETSVDRNEILIGDVFHLTVTITHEPQVGILRRETGMELGQFEIKEITPQDRETLPDGKIRETIDYQLSTFFTGDFEIPAFEILYQSDSGETGSIHTTPIKITIRSLTPEESEDLDIRDIKEPVILEGPSRMWIVWTVLGSLVALALLIYAIWRYFKFRQPVAPVIPLLPPHEQAYQSLRELRENREWRELRDYEFFSTRISEILRVYIGRRWGINALDETSEEILQSLQSLHFETSIFSKFDVFFMNCDLMKFAKHELPPEDLDDLIDQAERIVDETRDQSETTNGGQPKEIGIHEETASEYVEKTKLVPKLETTQETVKNDEQPGGEA